jgi:hypothetical protein
MADRKFRKGMFLASDHAILADEIEVGMIIELYNNKFFYVYDIDKEFISDEVAELYGENDPVNPEHSLITFADEYDNMICDVPGDQPILAYMMIKGSKHRCVLSAIDSLIDFLEALNTLKHCKM